MQKQWKEVVERACQARAEEVCLQISNDYEAKIAVVNFLNLIFTFFFLNKKGSIALVHSLAE